MLKLYKIIFFNMMIVGTLISISSYTWMGMWMGLEINLLSIIPLFSSTKNMYSSESSLKYFITQAMASLILLFSITMMLLTKEFIPTQMNSSFLMMLNSALLTKLGAAPFHFWFAEVMEGLSWMNCSILLTWQKIAPMILIMNNNPLMFLTMMSIIISLIVSTTLSFNQTSLRKIMTFSSINHIAWMLSLTLTSFNSWMIYLIVYTIITLNMTFIFNLNKMFFINQLTNFMNSNKMLKITIMMNFLSLGGLPPFLGFLPKWLTINNLINSNMQILAISLILLTLIMLFIYIRLIMTSMILQFNENKLLQTQKISKLFMIINILTMPSLILCTYLIN